MSSKYLQEKVDTLMNSLDAVVWILQEIAITSQSLKCDYELDIILTFDSREIYRITKGRDRFDNK